MVAKYLTARPLSPPPSSSAMSSTSSSSAAASPLTQISGPPPQATMANGSSSSNGHSPFVVQSRSPLQIGLNVGASSAFHGVVVEENGYGGKAQPSTPLIHPPPPGAAVGIGGKFIFKSNVIQGPGEMPPGTPFLLMKPQGGPPPTPNSAFPADHGRVILVPGRHLAAGHQSPPLMPPTGPSPHPQSTTPGPNGHPAAPQISSLSHPGAPGIPGPNNNNNNNSNGISSSVNGGGGGQSNGRRSTNGGGGGNGKISGASAREKKDLFTQRKQREFIPDNKKDDNYWDRRRRNNEAAKRSREKRRFNDMILEQRVIELTKENHILKAQLDAIKDKYNICGENLISLDQILNTMPTPDQVLNVNTAGNLTIASGLTTQHFRNFQLAREARAESVISSGSSPPAPKKLKVSPKSEDRSNSGQDDDLDNEMPPQPDSQRRDKSPPGKEFYKHTVSPLPSNGGLRHLVNGGGGGSGPLPLNKSPPTTGLINYSLRDMYYGGSQAPLENASALLANRGPLPNGDNNGHLSSTGERNDPEFASSPFQYASSSTVPLKYEDPDTEVSPPPPQQPQHHHHCPSPPYRPHPAHLPIKVGGADVNNNNGGPFYSYDELRNRRRRYEETEASSAVDDDQEMMERERERERYMLMHQQRHQRQPEEVVGGVVVNGGHLSQLELILNLSAKRDTDLDQRSVDDQPEVHCNDRDSPVLVAAKNHANLLPLKLRHKNNNLTANVKQEVELRRTHVVHSDEGEEEDHHHHHHHHHHPYHHLHHNPGFDAHGHNSHLHHHHHMHHLRHSPDDEPKSSYSEDSRLVKTEDYDEEEEELHHPQARRVHCCIEVEKLSSPRTVEDDEDEKRMRSSGEGSHMGGANGGGSTPKPNNIQLKTQLARLESEMATIKNMMYMNTNQATVAQ